MKDALPEMIPLSEAFIQIWVRRPKVEGKKKTQDTEMAPPPPPTVAPPAPKKMKY